MIERIRQIGRKALPASFRKAVNRALWGACRVQYQLRSGIKITLRSSSDWYIFNELFVEGDYDPALEIAITSADKGRTLVIVDIGANVGLFALRAVDRLRSGEWTLPFYVTAIEGNPHTASALQANVTENNLSGLVDVVTGLVGQKTGTGFITDHDFCGRNTAVKTGKRGLEALYLDLSVILSKFPQIDLLKCDIEGSELEFLENYPDILTKTNVAVFEFHPMLCDTRRCRGLLEEAGFRGDVLNETPEAVLLRFCRRAAPIFHPGINRDTTHAGGI